MTGYGELLAALREARQCTAPDGDPARTEAAVGRLERCLADGLPLLGPSESQAVADEIRQLLLDNRFQLRWTQIRSQLARIGAPPLPKSGVPHPRLDLVS